MLHPRISIISARLPSGEKPCRGNNPLLPKAKEVHLRKNYRAVDLPTPVKKGFVFLKAHKSSVWVGLGAVVLGFSMLWWQAPPTLTTVRASMLHGAEARIGAFPLVVPTIRYGFAIDTFEVYEARIRPNEFLADILMRHRVPYEQIDRLVRRVGTVFDVRQLRAGKRYVVLSRDTNRMADYFIYEPTIVEYYVFDLKQASVRRVERPVQTRVRTASGLIESSLWHTMVRSGFSFELAAKMEDAFQWTLDFHHLQRGDYFKLVYEAQYIEGREVGVGRILAAYYNNQGVEYYAIWYDQTEEEGYYDLEGRPMNKGFLKAPVKYARISSAYNPRRFHPILRRVRPHLGTDYAAPYGTPILAVGDGVVVKAGYTSGNGNYVKIRHNDTYATQYLHMQRFAKGIRVGAHVKQGQVIGYVGSTGLATGPHVCFRFWKNGRQVDHRRLTFPPPVPLPQKELPAFFKVRDVYVKMLKQVPEPQAYEREDAFSS